MTGDHHAAAPAAAAPRIVVGPGSEIDVVQNETAEGIEVTDPEGYLDMSVPTPMVDRLDREQRRRVRHDEDPVLWAWNLPYLLRGPYLVAERDGAAPA